MKVRDVVVLVAAKNQMFNGCLMVVEELKPWGAQGYVQIPGKGRAFYRATTQEMKPVGHLDQGLKMEVEALGDVVCLRPDWAIGQVPE